MKSRLLSACFALVMAAALCAAPAVAPAAQTGYEPANPYVLNWEGVYSGPEYQYLSPYKARVKVGNANARNVQTYMFTMYNTLNGAVIPVYCTDVFTPALEGSYYQRLNLEDSTYAGNVAGRLRSVMLYGYPNVDIETLSQRANIDGLTVCEALHAMQLATWHIAHGNEFVISDFLCAITDNAKWGEGKTLNPSVIGHYDVCYAEVATGYSVMDNEEIIASHVEALFNYLVNLSPTAPLGVAVSDDSFVSWSNEPVVTHNEDGTCNVAVAATVNVQMSAGDRLVLSAVLESAAGYHASVELYGGSHEYYLTIEGVPAEVAYSDVMLAIDGTQTVSDVFIFNPVGNRSASQTMLALDGSSLPVHVQVDVETERMLTINKYGNGSPLEGIKFVVYYVAGREEFLSGEVVLPPPGAYDMSDLGEVGIYTIVTNAAGYGEMSFTRNNFADGVYLVVERAHPAIVAPVDPFYVIIPATSPDGTRLEYTVNAQPKNQVYLDAQIEKDVIELGNDEASVDAYGTHTWIISSSIPKDLANGKSYVISDALDNRLDFLGNVKVQVESADGETVVTDLVQGVDYTLTVTDADSLAADKPCDSFAIELTASGMKTVWHAVGDAFANYKVRVYFDAQVNANALVAQEIPNQAALHYTNSVGLTVSDESDIPVVYTGGIELVKVDAADPSRLLAGAQFEVYRVATEHEMANEAIEKQVIEGINGSVVPVEFFDNPGFTGQKVTSVTTNESGRAYLYGLTYGTYYIVEVKAPAGYNLLGAPLALTVDQSSHLEANATTIQNVSGAVMPSTGGPGTQVFVLAGACLMAVSAAFLVKASRRAR